MEEIRQEEKEEDVLRIYMPPVLRQLHNAAHTSHHTSAVLTRTFSKANIEGLIQIIWQKLSFLPDF